jgi:ABC transporter substrate binding protein
MRRREFIAGLGSGAVWPLAARAQQGDRVRRIGVLMPGDENDPVRKTYVSAFTQALAGLGWTDGRNMPNVFMLVHRVPIISAAARSNVPAVYELSEFARDGGLLSYGVDRVDLFRRAATYVDRILRGAKPGDLPVQFPVKYEMAVNLKTAKSLGLTVPQSILLRADEVIE